MSYVWEFITWLLKILSVGIVCYALMKLSNWLGSSDDAFVGDSDCGDDCDCDGDCDCDCD